MGRGWCCSWTKTSRSGAVGPCGSSPILASSTVRSARATGERNWEGLEMGELAPSGALESKRTAGEPVQATGLLPHRTSTFHPQSHPVSSCAADTRRPQSLPIQAPGGSRKPAGRGEAAVHFRPAGLAPRPLLRPPPPPPRPGPLLRMTHPRPTARRWGDAVVWAARPPAATTGFPSSRGHAWGTAGPGQG